MIRKVCVLLAVPAAALAFAASAVAGGQITTSTPRRSRRAAFISPTNLTAGATGMCIFQLAATRGVRTAQRSINTATPGSTLPSINSSVAPPPVLMWVILSAYPNCSTAEAVSPPPTIDSAGDSATARATA